MILEILSTTATPHQKKKKKTTQHHQHTETTTPKFKFFFSLHIRSAQRAAKHAFRKRKTSSQRERGEGKTTTKRTHPSAFVDGLQQDVVLGRQAQRHGLAQGGKLGVRYRRQTADSRGSRSDKLSVGVRVCKKEIERGFHTYIHAASLSSSLGSLSHMFHCIIKLFCSFAVCLTLKTKDPNKQTRRFGNPPTNPNQRVFVPAK